MKRPMIPACFLVVLAVMLACNITPSTPTFIPPGDGGAGGGGSGGGGATPTVITATATETPSPSLPPPAVAVLRVAYIKDGDVWVWAEGSSSLRLTNSGDASAPLLSEDGMVVAFERNGELWAANADGTNERQLVSTAYLAGLVTTAGDVVQLDKLVWQPGRHQLFFNTLVISGVAGYHIPQLDLYGVDADTPGSTIINYESPGSGGMPYPSPDGSMIALAQSDKVIFMEVSGAFWNVAFTFPSALTYSEWSYVPELVWRPDGSAVRLVVPATDPLSDLTQPSTFWNVPVSGAPTSLTTFIAVPVFGGVSAFPYISPDGQNVLYLAENASQAHIHSITAAGVDTDYVWYPSGSVGLLGWSPDSTHFTFWTPSVNEPGYGSIDTNMRLGDTPSASNVQWGGTNRYMFLSGDELRIEEIFQHSTLVDTGVTEFSTGIMVY